MAQTPNHVDLCLSATGEVETGTIAGRQWATKNQYGARAARLKGELKKSLRRAVAGLVPLLIGVAAPNPAHAAEFELTIDNGSARTWSEGLLTTAPILNLGAAPRPGVPEYNTYAYIHRTCSISDGGCSGSQCDNGNAQLLATRWAGDGIAIGENAWIVPELSAGETARMAFQAEPGARVYYVARVKDSLDDFVALHEVGDTSTLGAGLFDSNELPTPAVEFEISGYDVASRDASNGNGSSCSSECPPPKKRCYVAAGNGTAGGTYPQPLHDTMTLDWRTVIEGRYSDGIALGDVMEGGGREIVVVTQNDEYVGGSSWVGLGTVAVLRADIGSLRSLFLNINIGPDFGERDFMGFPLVEHLSDTDSQAEYMVGENVLMTASPGGTVHVRRGNGDGLWSSQPWGMPGMWNMGPSSADLRSGASNSGAEIVIGDWEGQVGVVQSDTGLPLNTLDVWEELSDHPYGHTSIGDVAPTHPGQEIVQAGVFGSLWALSAPDSDGALDVAWQGFYPEGYPYASGPALADVDGDGTNEIVVAVKAPGAVYAFDTTHGTTCKYRWDAPAGSDYSWTSPVVGDVDGDGSNEVVVLSSTGILSVLAPSATAPAAGTCAYGVTEYSRLIGNGVVAWFTPALANLAGSDAPDVVVATFRTLEVIDVAAQQLAFRYNDASANFYPSALVEAGESSGSIIVSGWLNGAVSRLSTPAGSPVPGEDWPTFMGSNDRRGAR